jgi:Flp pilus assembly protein TadG
MAIVLPVFIFLFVAIVDFGLYFNKRNVAQSAAWNGAKACVAGNDHLVIINATLLPLKAELDTPSPSCTDSTTVPAYKIITVKIKGNMLSPFTTALGLYPITAVGIAN